MVRELQPGIVVNDRLGIPGDFVTPEQYQPAGPMSADGKPIVWEACQTLNGSWGYDRDNLDWKPVDLLVRMLVDGVSKDGNLLLNVGPTARGEFDPRAIATLRGIGEWMRLHGRSIYGAGPSDVHAPAGLPLHAARRPALPAPVRLAVPACPPAGPGRQGRVRPAAQRRIGGRPHLACRRARRPARSIRRTAGRHVDAQAARAAPGRRGARRGAVPRSRIVIMVVATETYEVLEQRYHGLNQSDHEARAAQHDVRAGRKALRMSPAGPLPASGATSQRSDHHGDESWARLRLRHHAEHERRRTRSPGPPRRVRAG